MIIIRRVGAVLLAIAAVLVWFFMAPDEVKTQAQHPLQDRSGDISGALSDYESNNILASSAPQQQVVNGWAEKDLLAVIAKEQNDANTRAIPAPPVVPRDDRIPALIGLAVLGLALATATTPRVVRNRSEAAPTFHPGQSSFPQPDPTGV